MVIGVGTKLRVADNSLLFRSIPEGSVVVVDKVTKHTDPDAYTEESYDFRYGYNRHFATQQDISSGRLEIVE